MYEYSRITKRTATQYWWPSHFPTLLARFPFKVPLSFPTNGFLSQFHLDRFWWQYHGGSEVVLIPYPLPYPILIILYPLAMMDSQPPSAASADPSSLRAAALYRQPSDSQFPINGNQSNADAPKFSRMISNVGPPVDPTLHEISQPPKTDDIDQLPKTDDHYQPPKADDSLSTEATSPPVSEEKGWVRYVHPEGWIYFFKKHDNEPENIQLHVICGDLKGEIVTNPILNFQATNTTSHKSERLSDVKGEGPPVSFGYGGLHVQIYVDDQRWYASPDKALLFPQQLTDEEGQDHLVWMSSTMS